MRRILLSAVIAASMVVPVFAQPTFTPAEIEGATSAVQAAALEPALDKLMWCSAAFGILGPYLKQNGQGDAAAEVEQLGRTVTTRASEGAVSAGLDQSAYNALAQSYTIIAASQMTTQGKYSQQDCTEAAQ